jgi:hypothetical protein
MEDGVTEEYPFSYAIIFIKILSWFLQSFILLFTTDILDKSSSQISYHYFIMPSGLVGLVFFAIPLRKMLMKYYL